jgi:hypothetical protein
LRDVAHRRLLIRRNHVKDRLRRTRSTSRGTVRDQGEGLEAGTIVDDTESFDIDTGIFNLITIGRDEFPTIRPPKRAASAASINLKEATMAKRAKKRKAKAAAPKKRKRRKAKK